MLPSLSPVEVYKRLQAGEIRLIDVTGTEMTREQIPAMYRHLIPARLYKRLAVGEGEIALLFHGVPQGVTEV